MRYDICHGPFHSENCNNEYLNEAFGNVDEKKFQVRCRRVVRRLLSLIDQVRIVKPTYKWYFGFTILTWSILLWVTKFSTVCFAKNIREAVTLHQYFRLMGLI